MLVVCINNNTALVPKPIAVFQEPSSRGEALVLPITLPRLDQVAWNVPGLVPHKVGNDTD